MKLKAIAILLNAVLLAAFIVIFLLPLLLIGVDYFSLFWGRNWPIAVVFFAALAGVNAYFLLNWRLFSALEKEDWPATAAILEGRIFRRGFATAGAVRMLLTTYLVGSHTESVLALEAYLLKRRPGLLGRFSLQFGIPHLLSQDHEEAQRFFSFLLARQGLRDRDWVSWNRAFAFVQGKKDAEAKKDLLPLLNPGTDPVLRLLALYLLDVLARKDAEAAAKVREGREQMRARHTPEAFARILEKSGENIEVAVLSQMLGDASRWLFTPARGEAGGRAG
jgi:hypothetical protein